MFLSEDVHVTKFNVFLLQVHVCFDIHYYNFLQVFSPTMMTYLGRWAYVNIHLVTPQLLVSFLNTFMYFKHYDVNIIKVLERCLTKGCAEVSILIFYQCYNTCSMVTFVTVSVVMK